MTSFDADHLAYFGLNDVPSTLTDCIQDTKWRDALELWSEKNYTAENVKFLLAFQEAFGTLEPDSIDMTKMLPLFDEYVPESAPHQINISSEVRKSAEQAVADYRRFEEHGEHSPEGTYESWGGNQPPPPDFMDNSVKSVLTVSKQFYRQFEATAKKVREHIGQ
jgi:hypothetical protein